MGIRTWRFMFIGLLAVSVAFPASAQVSDEKARRKFVNTTTLVCITLENVRDTPMRCALEQSENRPTLLVSFEDGSKAQRYAPLVVSMLGPQLCDVTGGGRAQGMLALVDSKLKRATVYSCEERAFGGWIQLSDAGR